MNPVRDVYVFFWKRPQDERPWPAVVENYRIALAYPFRCSAIAPMRLTLDPLKALALLDPPTVGLAYG